MGTAAWSGADAARYALVSRRGRPYRNPIRIGLGLAALTVSAALAACGSSSPRISWKLAAACPGAVGPGGAVARRCPYTSVSSVGRRGEGVLRCPEALALAPDGDLYVGDQFSHVIQRFSPGGRFLGQWGSYGSGRGQFGAVDGLAVAPDGDVYVLDSTGDRVERFGAAGRLVGEWGGPGTALGRFDFGPGYGPDKPPGGGIAIGGGRVYVADSANNRIESFALDGSDAALVAGPGSAPGEVSSPRGMAVSEGVLFVADEGNHRVQALSLPDGSQGLAGGAGGEGRPGHPLGRPLYAEGTFGKGPGEFVNPFGVTVHGGRVYVVDDNNNRIAMLTRALRPLGEWDGAGTRYALSYIRAAVASRSGRIYVADTGHERIVVFDGEGRGVRAFGTPGITPGQLIAPLAVAAAPDGGVAVAETYGSRSPVYLFKPDPAGGARAQGAARRAEHGGDPGLPEQGEDPGLHYVGRIERGGDAIIGSHWFGPSAAAFAPDGSIWVTDPLNDVVRHLGWRGDFLGAVGSGGGAAGSDVGSGGGGGSGDSAAAAQDPASLLDPEGVAVAPSGEVYVADTGRGRIARFAADGRPLGTLGGGLLARPLAVALAPDGDLYVADGGEDRVVELSPAGRRLASWGGAGTAPGRFAEPAGVAVDAAGEVFVADRGNDRVQEFAAGGRLLAAWGRSGTGPGELSLPATLAVDCDGAVLVADTENNRVEVFAGAAARGSCVR